MKIKEIVSALEQFAPLPLQDGFDNAGLQIGFTISLIFIIRRKFGCKYKKIKGNKHSLFSFF